MLWKEVVAEPGLAFNWFGRVIVAIIVLVSILPAVWIGMEYFISRPILGSRGLITLGSFSWNSLDEAINRWVRSVGTLVACLTLLGVAVRAASSVSGERDRQTLDGLLTSPLTVSSILYAKWLGSIVSVRRAWLWLCLIWGLGLLAGGLDSSTLPWLVLAWFVYAGFVAMLGLWFSTVCRTTLRATLGTLATTAALGVGHWLLSLLGFFLILLPRPAGPRLGGDSVVWLLTVQLYGFTPPISLSWLAFHGQDFQLGFVRSGLEDPWAALMAIIVGFVCWTAAGGLLWRRTCARFGGMANRLPRRE